MTIGELLAVSPCCLLLEVEVRNEDGQLLQEFEVGEQLHIASCWFPKDFKDTHPDVGHVQGYRLKPMEILDYNKGISRKICVPVAKTPKYIRDLVITDIRGKDNYPHHPDMGGWDFRYLITAAPQGLRMEKIKADEKKNKDNSAQMNLSDFWADFGERTDK